MQQPWPDSDPAAIAACRDMLRGGSRSFFAASHLLPRSVRHPAIALYAFCRLADDAIDQSRGGEEALASLRERLDRVYNGQSLDAPADRALAHVVARFAIPRALPLALLDGLAWDAQGRRYDALAGVTAYAVRVAGSVGMMMALIMGARSSDALARACDLGVAMQFSNIARDVGEDARAGRIYLPLDWMRETGVDPDGWLRDPVFGPALGSVVRRLLARAQELYRRADSGIAVLPRLCRPGIRAARTLYAEIGDEVARAGYDSVASRAVVSGSRKLRVLTRGLLSLGAGRDGLSAPVLPEAAYLLDAVGPAPARPASQPPWRVAEARMVWIIELFQRLAERDAVEAAEP